MKTFKTLALVAAVAAGGGLAGGVLASEIPRLDGNLGDTSDVQFDITLTTQDRARIWGLQDIILENNDGVVSDTVTDRKFCVFSNSTDGLNKFDLDITSGNGQEVLGNSFKLVSLTGNETAVGYEITVKDFDNKPIRTTSEDPTFEGKDLNAGLLPSQPDPGAPCSGGQMSISITVDDLATPVAAGSYSDTITMQITPK